MASNGMAGTLLEQPFMSCMFSILSEETWTDPYLARSVIDVLT